MKKFAITACILAFGVFNVLAETVDARYCGTPRHDTDGKIHRSTIVLSDFRRIHPCPSTAKQGSCPGWQIDHVIPLACGGCDTITNLQWLPTDYKIGGKDQWERKIYDNGIPGTPYCNSAIVKP